MAKNTVVSRTRSMSPSSGGIRKHLDSLWAKILRLRHRSHNTAYDATYDASAHLPPEITDLIIDHLCADKDALIACSLVCTAFLNRSFYHLYGTLTIKDTRKFTKLVAFLPAAVFRRYVREVRLGSGSDGLSMGDAGKLCVDSAGLAGLFDALPDLAVVKMDCMAWTVESANVAEFEGPPRTKPKSIQQLTIDDVRSSASGVHLVINELASLLALFGTIKRLSIGNPFGHVPNAHTMLAPAGHAGALQIHSLTLQSGPINASFLRFLRETASVRTLSILHVEATDEVTLAELGHLLRKAKSVISVLQVDVKHLGPPYSTTYRPDTLSDTLNIPVNLSGSKSLRTLRFWVSMGDGMGTVGMWNWGFVFAVLKDAVLHLPNIENVVICISLGKTPKSALRYAREVDWSGLEMLMRQFRKLAYLGLGTPGPRSRNREMKDIDYKLWKVAKSRMPVLYKTRVLCHKPTYTN